MNTAAIAVGAFIWCRFPLREQPHLPGPADHLHLAYVQDVTVDRLLTIYTTSVTWDPSIPTPMGVMLVGALQAKALGQKPFVLDARRLALLPLTEDWFPHLSQPNHGIAAIAPIEFQQEVTRTAYAAATRASHLELLGPQARKVNRLR